jgi:kinesin family protein C1
MNGMNVALHLYSDEVKFLAVPDTDERGLDVTGASQKSADGLKTQQKSWSFEFDKVFMPTATQADVFVEISQLVQSALDGYKVSIMSFGQTGSGKTFTMEGPSSDAHDENRGMIPRAVEQIFAHCSALEAKGWRYNLEVMFLGTSNTDEQGSCRECQNNETPCQTTTTPNHKAASVVEVFV